MSANTLMKRPYSFSSKYLYSRLATSDETEVAHHCSMNDFDWSTDGEISMPVDSICVKSWWFS